VNGDKAQQVADNIGSGDVQLAAMEAELDVGDSTFDAGYWPELDEGDATVMSR
jgi:hypothetical protein